MKFENDGWFGARNYNNSLEYLNGKGVEKDEKKAFELNLVAAKTGLHDAILNVGWHYLNGIGVVEDVEKAIVWYKKSARHGDERAFFSLGEIEYTRKNYTSALNWFNEAIRKKHYRSLFWKAKIYYKGLDVEVDKRLAMELIQLGAAKKDETAQRVIRWMNRKSKL